MQVKEKASTGKKERVTVSIVEDMRIPGTNIVLEKGDRIQVLAEYNSGAYKFAKAELSLLNKHDTIRVQFTGGGVTTKFLTWGEETSDAIGETIGLNL